MKKRRYGPLRHTKEQVWAKIGIGDDPQKCWECGVWKDRKGYGKIRYNGKTWIAHRLVYFWVTGELPEVVMHTCDNPPCCNPAHLQGGTYLSNSRDSKNKKRNAFGGRIAQSVLTENQVLKIRKEYKNKNVSCVDLAKKHGASCAAIFCIVNGRTWKHLPLHKLNKKEIATKNALKAHVGEKHGCAILDEKKVIKIRQAHKAGASLADLGRLNGVTNYCIWRVVHRKTWKHVK